MPLFQPSNMFVTGGAGFIGANFIHYFLARHPNVRIVNLDLLTYAGSPENLIGLPQPGQHTFIKGDIADRPLVEHIFKEYAIDSVVHFAAESHVDRSISGPDAFIHTNLVGTWTLLETAKIFWQKAFSRTDRQVRFHHVSTDEVYGTLQTGEPPFHEETPYRPNSPYSACKAGADHLVRAYFHTYGLPTTQTNCSNNFGPRQHPEKLLPTVIRACMQASAIPVYGTGGNIRDWLHVDDHCDAIATVLHQASPGSVYNIGADNEWNNLDLIKKVCTIMDRVKPSGAPHARLITFITDRPGHDWRYALNAHKINQELGWQPQIPFDQGLEETVRWYCQQKGN
ncbi:MAG: dTDP-glucose 4,6-dehydratase [Magnetococcales bacterium]|nr:dTDP-glucose 4,6-dehydratase [Magnetococcales bacterium]MBF0321459.1 dTDP-glucose 4,6-dehydratase [Magnetococcales bacterium]